jgi:hypothetical protein
MQKSLVRYPIRFVLLGLVLISGCAGLDSRETGRAANSLASDRLRAVSSAAELDDLIVRGQDLNTQLDRRSLRWHCSKPRSERRWWVKCPRDRPRREGEEDAATLDTIEVTGSRIEAADLITNNQEAGVDEGDIVKKTGDRLLVLRGDVLYSVLIRRDGQDVLELADQLKLAVDKSGEEVWYDEILAFGDRVILLGFNYGQEDPVAEVHLFRLDADGRLQRDGRFWLKTDDYFSDENYGARLQGDKLLISLSMPLKLQGEMRWPEWSRRDVPRPAWQALVEAEDLYFPVLPSRDPHVHVVLQCPLSGLGGELDCRATGVVANSESVLYATPAHVFLALGAWDAAAFAQRRFHPDAWRSNLPESQQEAWRRTALMRIPFDAGALPGVAIVPGWVRKPVEFSGTPDGGLYLLSSLTDGEEGQSGLFRLEPGDFSSTPGPMPMPRALVPISDWPSVRFSPRAVWVGRTHWYVGEEQQSAEIHVQPLDGSAARQIVLPHSADQLQPAFGRMLVVGARADETLAMSWIGDAPQLAVHSTVAFEGRLMAERRSHSLNFGQLRGGTRLFSLPVMARQPDHDDYDYFERASDIQYVELASDRLRDGGVLDMQDPGAVPCEDCDDWYGNARAFVVGDRLFALSANLLKESRWDGRLVRERRRVALP